MAPSPAPALALQATALAAPSPAAPNVTGKPLTIGLITDLSGSLKRYGEMEVRGFGLGLEYATQGTLVVAGRPLQVVTRDSEGKIEKAAELARQLIDEGAEIVQCCASSAAALAAQEALGPSRKVLMIDPAASPDLTGKRAARTTFRTSRTTDQEALAAAPYFVKNAGGSFVQLAPDDAFGRQSAATWRRAVEGAGGRFVADDLFVAPDTTEFRTVLKRAVDSKAQVFIITWAGQGFTELFSQLVEQGVTQQMTVATSFNDNLSIRSAYGAALGIIGPITYHYALPKNPVNDWLVTQHQRRFGAPPDIYTAGAMAAGIALVDALKKTGGGADPDRLSAALEGLSFDSPKGRITLRAEDHLALQSVYIVRLKSTTDPQFRFFELLAEIQPEASGPPVATPK